MSVELILARKGREVRTIRPDASVEEALRRLRAERIGALVVSGDGARLVGLASERDILHTIADRGVGVLSGILGGTTGFGGILPTIWCTLRGWPKDEQRAVFQPTCVAIFLGTALLLGGSGSVTSDTMRLF